MYIQVKDSQLPNLRKELLESQNNIDLITGQELKYEDSVVDHKHREYAGQKIGENGAGLIRGVLDRRINAFEGKIFNAYKRYGVDKVADIPLPELLRKVADYLESNTTNYIYPSEAPKSLTISIMQYKKLKKAYDIKYPNRNFEKNHPIPYKGKLTDSFVKILEEFDMLEDVKNNQVSSIHKIFKQKTELRTLQYLDELNRVEREQNKK